MTITEFLEARIAEDEALASSATAGPWRWDDKYGDKGDTGLALTNDAKAEIVGAYNHHCCAFRDDPLVEDNDAAFIARHDPSRVLAECAAKRAIVEGALELEREARALLFDPWVSATYKHSMQWFIRPFAAVYKDHPDYRQEWAA